MATRYAGDLLKEIGGDIFDRDLSVEVTNESGLVLMVIMVHVIGTPLLY